MKEKVIQFAVSHKTVNDPILSSRTILYVNENIAKESTNNSISTYTLDNIDYLNPYYCELTALYWIWKNTDSDIVSFEHYRRLFCDKSKSFFSYKAMNKDKIEKILKKFKIIIPSQYHIHETIYQHYVDHHSKGDLDCLRKQIEILNPEYLKDFDLFFNGHVFSLFNMFVMKRKDLNDYCDFAFPLLNKVFEIRKEDILKRDSYQQRSIGYLSERLFNVWVYHNLKKEDIYYCPVIETMKNKSLFVDEIMDFARMLLGHDYYKR